MLERSVGTQLLLLFSSPGASCAEEAASFHLAIMTPNQVRIDFC